MYVAKQHTELERSESEVALLSLLFCAQHYSRQVAKHLVAVCSGYYNSTFYIDNTYKYVYNNKKENNMPTTSKAMIKKLKKHGFEIISQNGSHVKLTNKETHKTVIVPYHCRDLKTGLEQAILKQAGIKEEK